MYCAVCGQDESSEWFEFQSDDGSIPTTWVLCATCAQSVRRELARTRLHSPARLRVAIAMVASEHAASSPPVEVDQRQGERVERLLIATVLGAFLVHALAFLLVVVFIASPH